MKPFYDNIEEATLENLAYRHVVYTDSHLQLVYMTLLPQQEIGLEAHRATQFFRIEAGEGIAVVEGRNYHLSPNVVIIIPSNTYHNIINTSEKELLQLYTLYSPPQHPPQTYEPEKPEND